MRIVRPAFQVPFEYEVHFTHGLVRPANPLLRAVPAGGPRRRVVGLLLALGFELSCPELAGPSLADGLEDYRAHLGGPLALTLPAGIRRAVEVHGMERDAIAEATGGLARVQTAWQEGDWRWAS